ncbi:hypothetical protein LTR78_009022 [Recurvomyces mirabilis]|uniref:Uncharacterized protein n=1 Tax=Recurvomyces mirabilis TaxID=574656 RepID=A0AAE0WFH9_9PEZI|nr:hypothetical protein LTR78_009022 [Recurvomyces mirabilis]KAK5150451.1 hypothetical protein LTS14_010141 [Recurvomyces mirabilis]
MAAAAVCPVVGTSTTVLPPGHPEMSSDPEARCPVTNAKVAHHDSSIIHNHPTSPSIPKDSTSAMDAEQCPAVKSMASKDPVENEICPVVGPVSAYLPPTHPNLTEKEAGKVCPVTNAKLEHHEGKVHVHPKVADDAPAQKCPVAGAMVGKQAA